MIAVLGVVVAVVGTVVIWDFLGDLETSTERSLLIGEQVTATLTDTIDVAEEVLTAVDSSLATVQATLETLSDVVASTSGLAGAASSLSSTLPAGFENIDAALATVESLGGTVDSALTTLSQLPFGPDYDPETGFADAVQGLRDSIDPIAQDVTTISTELENFASSTDELTAQIDALVPDVEQARQALTGTDELLDQYREATVEANQLAASTRDQLSGSMTRTRWVLVALGLLLALTQYVPWTLAGMIESTWSKQGLAPPPPASAPDGPTSN